MTRQEFFDFVNKNKPVLLDGAMGSNLLSAGMPRNVCQELWIMEHPLEAENLQKAYVEAGSQIIYAPTFSANRVSLTAHGLEDRVVEINETLVRQTKEHVEGRALVAGDLTMTGELVEPFGDTTEEELIDIYKEQITGLVGGGADLLVIETVMTVQEMVAALRAARAVCDLPLMCTYTVTASGMTMYGADAVESIAELEAEGAAAVGLNCSLGPAEVVDVIRRMKEKAAVPLIAKPNAGLPRSDGFGNTIYDLEAKDFAEQMKAVRQAGADLLGGCCGSRPDYIRSLKGID